MSALVLAMTGGCASTAHPGPDGTALTALIAAARPGSAPKIRAVKCGFIEEEGSEWSCRYRERAADDRWVPLQTYVAADGEGWRLIDTPIDPDHPPEP